MKMNGYKKQNCACYKKKVTVERNFRGWIWKTEIENEKKEIQRNVTITLHLQIKHQQKESENIEKIKDW